MHIMLSIEGEHAIHIEYCETILERLGSRSRIAAVVARSSLRLPAEAPSGRRGR